VGGEEKKRKDVFSLEVKGGKREKGGFPSPFLFTRRRKRERELAKERERKKKQ